MYKITYVFCDDPARLTREVELMCTNVSDLPDVAEIVRKGFEPGSTAYVTKTKQKFILNNENEWDECSNATSGSSGGSSIIGGYTKKEVDEKISGINETTETIKTDILSLKEDLSRVVTFGEFVKGRISDNGTIQESTTRCYSDLLYVKDANLNVISGYKYILYEYTSAGVFIKKVSNSWKIDNIFVEGEHYFRIMLAYTDDSTITDATEFDNKIFFIHNENHRSIESLSLKIDGLLTSQFISKNIDANDFAVGATNDGGEYQPTSYNRITTPDIQNADTDMKYTVDSGYRYMIITQIDDTWTSSEWLTTDITVKKGTKFKINMARAVDSGHVTVSELLPNLHQYFENTIITTPKDVEQIEQSLSDVLPTDIKEECVFAIGSLNTNTGEMQTNARRISMYPRKKFNRIVEISHDFENFSVGYVPYLENAGQYGEWSGWFTESFSIPANTPFQLMIKHTGEESTYTVSLPLENDNIYKQLTIGYGNEIVSKTYLDERLKDIEVSTAKDYDIPAYVKGLTGDLTDFRMDSTTKAEDIYAWYDDIMNTFPNFITRETIGTTTTPTGTWATKDSRTYPIYCYTIKCNPNATKKIILGGGIHGASPTGDPIEGVVACAYYIRDLMFNQKRNKYMQYMYDNCVIKLIPLINPWGVQNDSRGNGNGVDLNRNFDYNYVANQPSYDGLTTGTSAFSENESAAIRDFLTENTDALFFSEIHARMNLTIPNDTRWLTLTNDTETQSILVAACNQMNSIYAGVNQNTLYTAQTATPTCHSYAYFVKGIKSYEPEFFRSNNLDENSLDGLFVMLQAVNWYAVQIQMLVEYYCMTE